MEEGAEIFWTDLCPGSCHLWATGGLFMGRHADNIGRQYKIFTKKSIEANMRNIDFDCSNFGYNSGGDSP